MFLFFEKDKAFIVHLQNITIFIYGIYCYIYDNIILNKYVIYLHLIENDIRNSDVPCLRYAFICT